MASNFLFGLVAFSEVNEILVLHAQTNYFSSISYYFWASEDTFHV